MTQNGTKIIFDLPATLDADAAPVLVADFKNMEQPGEVRLNAAAVTALSPGYLQILIAAFKTFPQITVADASPVFVEAFALCGLAYPIASSDSDAAAAEWVSGAEKSATPADIVAPDDSPGAADPAAPAEETADAIPIVPGEEAPSAPTAALPVALAEEPPSAAAVAPEPPNAADAVGAAADEPPVEASAAPAAAPPSDTGTPAQPDTSQSDEIAAPKTILTIDDSRTMRDMLKMALGGAGFTVLQAVDGQDGLNVLARQPVDLIITDINMPKLDGYGVIRAVRKDPTYNDTPILVLSTEGEQESKDIAKDAGATGWIVKPFDPDGLVKIVNTVCG